MRWTLVFLLVSSFLISCASTDEAVDTSTAEGGFKIAKELEDDERFEEAIIYYNDVKNKFPYSRYAVMSKLRIADIHYKKESYLEAESAYKLFKEFHPRHEKIDYVTFRLGMSYYKQLPKTIDRDLKLANDAIFYFDQVIRSYPNSDYVGAARDFKRKCRRKLAKKELYIADFYFIRDMYDSALSRYENIINEYKSEGYQPQALYGATISAIKTKDTQKAKQFYARLEQLHSKSSEFKKIKREYSDELK